MTVESYHDGPINFRLNSFVLEDLKMANSLAVLVHAMAKGLHYFFFLLYLGLCKLEKAKNAENHIFRTKNVIF